jgi:hypothetical protein
VNPTRSAPYCPPTSPKAITIRDVLLGSAADARNTAYQQLRRRGGISALDLPILSDPAQDMVYEQAAGCVVELLDIEIVTALAEAWRTHSALTAPLSLDSSRAIQVIELAAHRVTYTCQPSIELMVDGSSHAKVPCELVAVFDVHGLAGAVQAGRLVSVRRGDCDLTASFVVAGRTIALRKTRLDLRLSLHLGAGIWLAPAGAGTPA